LLIAAKPRLLLPPELEREELELLLEEPLREELPEPRPDELLLWLLEEPPLLLDEFPLPEELELLPDLEELPLPEFELLDELDPDREPPLFERLLPEREELLLEELLEEARPPLAAIRRNFSGSMLAKPRPPEELLEERPPLPL
jgi:hypothetical protein